MNTISIPIEDWNELYDPDGKNTQIPTDIAFRFGWNKERNDVPAREGTEDDSTSSSSSDDDCIIVHAHKVVIAFGTSKLPEFLKLFHSSGNDNDDNDNNNSNNNKAVVDVDNIEPEIFTIALKFIYKIEQLLPMQDIAKMKKLFIFAIKFNYTEFKNFLEKAMVESENALNGTNAASYYVFSGKHKLKQLKSSCLEIITINFNDVVTNDKKGWTELNKSLESLMEFTKVLLSLPSTSSEKDETKKSLDEHICKHINNSIGCILNKSNAISFYILGHKFDLHQLKSSCLRIITINFDEVVTNDERGCKELKGSVELLKKLTSDFWLSSTSSSALSVSVSNNHNNRDELTTVFSFMEQNAKQNPEMYFQVLKGMIDHKSSPESSAATTTEKRQVEDSDDTAGGKSNNNKRMRMVEKDDKENKDDTSSGGCGTKGNDSVLKRPHVKEWYNQSSWGPPFDLITKVIVQPLNIGNSNSHHNVELLAKLSSFVEEIIGGILGKGNISVISVATDNTEFTMSKSKPGNHTEVFKIYASDAKNYMKNSKPDIPERTLFISLIAPCLYDKYTNKYWVFNETGRNHAVCSAYPFYQCFKNNNDEQGSRKIVQLLLNAVLLERRRADYIKANRRFVLCSNSQCVLNTADTEGNDIMSPCSTCLYELKMCGTIGTSYSNMVRQFKTIQNKEEDVNMDEETSNTGKES